MRKVSFYWIAAFLLAVFVLSMGGCGGSSNSFSYNNNNNNDHETGSVEENLRDSLAGSDMASVMHGNEWVDLINEFEEAGSGDKMNPQSWVYCITDEEEEKLREKYADDELSLEMLEGLLFDADRISRDYAAENIVLLIYPNEDFINRTLEAVGLDGDYVMNSNGKRLEMFAIAKRTVNNRTFTFRYQAFRGDEAVITSIRVSEDAEAVITPEENESGLENSENEESTTTDDDDRIFFNIDRWRSYYNWCASLTDMANESDVEASAIEVRAAADNDLTKIAEAQSDTLDFNHYQTGYRPWAGAIGGDEVTIKRTNQVSLRVYTCHSYRYHCDYYLVQANATTRPQNYQDRMNHKFTWYQGGGEYGRYGYTNGVNYLSGYTGSFGFDSYIYSVVSGNENSDLSTREVALLKYIPTNVPKNKTVTEGISWNIGGAIGIGKDGPNVSINGGVSHSSSETWTTSDWEITANPLSLKNASVTWNAGVVGPSNSGSWHSGEGGEYMGINATGASTNTLSFTSEWIWQIDSSVWSKQDTNRINMSVVFFFEEGFCYGEGSGSGDWSHWVSYDWNGGRRYPRFEKPRQTMNLDMPRHSWVSQKNFDISANGDKSAGLGFNILSEGKWEVSATQKVNGKDQPANWITFTNPSGEATGENEYPVRFQVAENKTGSPRQAKITFTAYVGDKITEESIIYVNQAAK